MTRTERLLTLMQVLRQNQYPVTGSRLADELDISIRTLYRDIETLKQQGARIEGEAGVGYILKPGYFLPPLMFTQDEIEVLMLGLHWVKTFGDISLVSPCKTVLSKVSEVLPKSMTKESNYNYLRVGPPPSKELMNEDLSEFREAIKNGEIIRINYSLKKQNKIKTFTVWPISIGYFSKSRTLVAWNPKENKFSYFETNRIESMYLSDKKYPVKQEVLFKQWHSIVLSELKKTKTST
ncbi:YafY family protein [Halobacteriovorax sp. XZX-3]|uniref:helix-turn-helix transcriptional regulator n=1 Tax=unclassified Halobacteriovorax TaxID=2639665 RepID=UPI00371BF509